MPKIVVCKDITDEQFLNAARAAWAAGAAGAARAARAAGVAGAAGAAGAARAAGAAGAAWAAGVAGAAWAAGAARAAGAAGVAGAAGAARAARAAGIDYDFDYFVQEFEYLQYEKGNADDKKALKLYSLFFEAKKAGLGYFAEKDGKLFICPNAIVKIDNQNRFHSLKEPAISWKDGLEVYFISGVVFEKELWQKVPTMSAKEVFAIENMEQRRVAYEVMDKTKMKNLGAKVLDEVKDDGYGHPMKVIQFDVNEKEK